MNLSFLKHPFFVGILSLLGLGLLWMIMAPLLGMLLSSSWSGLFETAQEEEVLRSIGLTLSCSLGATLVVAPLAISLAYMMVRFSFPLKSFWQGIINLPIMIPHSTAGIALLGVLNRDSFLGQIAENSGLSFIGSPLGISVAMAFVSLPFFINVAQEGFQKVPVELENTALTLGASPWKVFWTISLPLAKSSLLTGSTMMFARGLSEFGAVLIIAYHPMISPVLIYERFSQFGLEYARNSAILFLLVSLAVLAFLNFWIRKSHA